MLLISSLNKKLGIFDLFSVCFVWDSLYYLRGMMAFLLLLNASYHQYCQSHVENMWYTQVREYFGFCLIVFRIWVRGEKTQQIGSYLSKQSTSQLVPASLQDFALEILPVWYCVPVQLTPKWGNDSNEYSWLTLQAFPSLIQYPLLQKSVKSSSWRLLKALDVFKKN